MTAFLPPREVLFAYSELSEFLRLTNPCPAGSRPERVSALVSLDALGPWPDPMVSAAVRASRGLDSREHMLRRVPRVYKTRAEAIARMRAGNPNLLYSSTEVLCDRALRRTDDGFVFRHDPRQKGISLVSFSEVKIKSFFERVSAPVLAIFATQERKYDTVLKTFDTFKVRSGWLSDCQIVYPQIQVGHHLHLDAADEVSSLIVPFLRLKDVL